MTPVTVSLSGQNNHGQATLCEYSIPGRFIETAIQAFDRITLKDNTMRAGELSPEMLNVLGCTQESMDSKTLTQLTKFFEQSMDSHGKPLLATIVPARFEHDLKPSTLVVNGTKLAGVVSHEPVHDESVARV